MWVLGSSARVAHVPNRQAMSPSPLLDHFYLCTSACISISKAANLMTHSPVHLNKEHAAVTLNGSMLLDSVAVLSETPLGNTTCRRKDGTGGFKFPDSVICRSSFALNRVPLLHVAMANLGCQLGYIWDRLKPKHLGML